MSKKQRIKRINWFWAVLAALSLVKLLLIQGLVICPLVTAACDDALMENWAINIANGNWTGPFSCYIFTKEIGFSFYLAVINRLHLPYFFATNLLYIVAGLMMLYAVSHVVQKKWILSVIYAVTLFHPIMTAVQSGQRVYRNAFAAALTLLIFACLLNLYFEIAEESFLRNCAWSALAACSLGYLWETKSDTIWLMPFTLTVLLVAAVIVIKKKKILKAVPRLCLLLIPVLGIQLFSFMVNMLNVKFYGAPGIAYYGPAMSVLTRIDAEDAAENISLSWNTFQELCQYSPTLATTAQKVERVMEKYDDYDTHPGDGYVEDGWIGWALVRAFQRSGYYTDCQTANTFYQKVYEELKTAVDEGKIKLKQKSFLDSYHLATAKERKELFATIGQIWNYVASHQQMFSDTCEVTEESMIGSQGFEILTRERAYYADMETDYYCVGWILYPQYDLNHLKVYVEDAQGKQLEKIEFKKSWDVRAKYNKTKGAEKCRFKVKWNYRSQEENPNFYVAAYDGTKQVARNQIGREGFEDMDDDICVGSVDGYFSKQGLQSNHKAAQWAVKRCNFIYYIYHGMGYLLAWSGVIAYVVFTIFAVSQWRLREFETVNVWLVITGIGLSLLVLFAGVAVTHLESCPAISYMYLSAAYPLFNLAALLSLVKCMECIVPRFFRLAGRFRH